MSLVVAAAADNRPVAAGIPAMLCNLAVVSAVAGLAGAAASAAADSPATQAGPGYYPDFPSYPPCGESVAHINYYVVRVYRQSS